MHACTKELKINEEKNKESGAKQLTTYRLIEKIE
jgi:hypothetical protein